MAGVSTLTPLPVSFHQVRAYLSGTGTALAKVADRAGTTETKLAERAIRAAQSRLEEGTGTRFFVTRFCTEVLAGQEELVLGTDYDEIVPPQSFQSRAWRNASGKHWLPWSPVWDLAQMRMSLADGDTQGSGKIVDFPANWFNLNHETGEVNMMINPAGATGLEYYTLFAVAPLHFRAGLQDNCPLVLHHRYTAGLVQRTGSATEPDETTLPYDPEADRKNTRWPQQKVEEWQEQIGLLASVPLLRMIGQHLANGGVSVSLDGMSQQVNVEYLKGLADERHEASAQWVATYRQASKGPEWVWV